MQIGPAPPMTLEDIAFFLEITWSHGVRENNLLSVEVVLNKNTGHLSMQLQWLQSLSSEIDLDHTAPSKLWNDNTSGLALTSNAVFHARTKHVEVDVHFIREKVQAKLLDVGFVSSEEQIADILTKPLLESVFNRFRQKLCLGP